MAEVHEITSTALAELINSHGLDVCPSIARGLVSTKELVGQFLLVECFAFFNDSADTPYLYGTREEMTDAVWRTVGRHNNSAGMYHCASEMEVWHVVDDEPEDDELETYGLYQRYALEAYLGDFADEYDIDAIEDAVTVLDYSTGNRYWTMDDKELAEYVAGLTAKEVERPAGNDALAKLGMV